MADEGDKAPRDRSLARIDSVRAAGEQIAAALRADKHLHQEYAAIKAGVSKSTYWRWLSGESEADLLFQALVLPAVYEQAELNRKEAELAIGCVEAGSGPWMNWHRWLLEKRYRKIYGDLAQEVKLEVTGKDGGPIQTMNIAGMSDAELEAALAKAKAGEK